MRIIAGLSSPAYIRQCRSGLWPSNKALLSSGVTPSNSGVSLEISPHSGHHLPPRRRSQLKVTLHTVKHIIERKGGDREHKSESIQHLLVWLLITIDIAFPLLLFIGLRKGGMFVRITQASSIQF